VIQGFTKRVRTGGPRGGSGGGGNNPLNKFGPLGMFVGIGLIALVLTSFYTVDQTEEALVLRLGKYQRTAAPGLNFKFPTPIETVIKQETKVVKKTDIGGNSRTSLMLTGDENIVDINFTVLWRISDIKNFIFEVDETPVAVRAVAESAMREIIGKNKLEEIITTGRLDITLAVRDLMQETLNEYNAGVEVVEVQLQKADPPSAVVESFRDVVNAAQDAETKVNQATAIKNDIVPKARGEAAQIIQDAEAYKGRVVAEAEESRRRPIMKNSSVVSIVIAGLLFILIVNCTHTVREWEQALVLEFGQAKRVQNAWGEDASAGLKFKMPYETVVTLDRRNLEIDLKPVELLASDQERLVVDAFVRYRISDATTFYEALQNELGAQQKLQSIMDSTLRDVLGRVDSPEIISGRRSELMSEIQQVANNVAKNQTLGVEIIDVRIKRADLPQR